MTSALFWHIVGAGEPASYNFTISSSTTWAYTIADYRNVDSVSALPYTVKQGANGNSATSTISFTTTVSNTMVVGSFASNNIGTISGLGDILATGNSNSWIQTGDQIYPTAGAVTLTQTRSSSGLWAATAVALNPGTPQYNLSAYRWFQNTDSIQNSDNLNPSPGDDEAQSVAIDPVGGYRYTVGYYNASSVQEDFGWMITKTNLVTGALVTSFNSGGAVPGEIQENLFNGYQLDDVARSIAIDPANDAMYVAGYDRVATGDSAWRIEKRTLSTGAFVTSFNGTGYIQENNSASHYEGAYSIAIDPANDAMYVAGFDYNSTTSSDEWRIEKRTLSTGAGVTGFGGANNGYVTDDISSGSDQPYSVALDKVNNKLYVGGMDRSPGHSEQSLGAYDATTGALVTSFGTDGKGHFQHDPSTDSGYNAMDYDSATGNIYAAGYYTPAANTCGWEIDAVSATNGQPATSFNGTGYIENHYSSGCDSTRWIAHDGSAIYSAGFDAVNGDEWRIEKRDKTTGALVTGFANGGVVTAKFYDGGGDWVNGLAVDSGGGYLYAAGASQPTPGNVQWQNARLSLTTGSFDQLPLAAQNSVIVPFITAQARLRFLLQTTQTDVASGGESFKLQYALKSGTCDAGFVGETYQDVGAVGAATPLRYYDNPSLTTGTSINAGGIYLQNGSDANSGQSYVEANNFSVANYINKNSDGLWDASLESNGAFTNASYCLRVVKSDGSLLNTYSIIPEFDVCSSPATSDQLRGGAYFCNGSKTPSYFWSR
jgi:hypothetical protein